MRASAAFDSKANAVKKLKPCRVLNLMIGENNTRLPALTNERLKLRYDSVNSF